MATGAPWKLPPETISPSRRRRPSGCPWRRWLRSSSVRATNPSASRAAPCTWAAQRMRVGVLHAAAVPCDALMRAAGEQRDGCCAAEAAGRRRAAPRESAVERPDRPAQRINRQRRRDVRRAREPLGPASASAATAVEGCVPLMSASPSFASSTTGVSPARASASRRRHHACVVADGRLAFADQHQRQVGERREIAARADRSAARHARVHARFSSARAARASRARMPEKPFASTFARSAIVARTARDRQRIADAGGMAAEQVELQRAERVVRNARLGERAEAGVDAVDRLVSGRAARPPRARDASMCARAPPARRHRRTRRRRSRVNWSRVSEDRVEEIMRLAAKARPGSKNVRL